MFWYIFVTALPVSSREKLVNGVFFLGKMLVNTWNKNYDSLIKGLESFPFLFFIGISLNKFGIIGKIT